MESVFFTLLTTSGVYFILKFLKSGKWKFVYAANLFFGISALTRPEGFLFFIVTWVFLLYYLQRKNEYTFYNLLKRSAFPVMIFLSIFLTYFTWRYNYYGYFLPNTFYAKTGIRNQQIAGIYYVYKFIRESLAMGLLLVFPVYLLSKEFKNTYLQLLLFIIFTYIAYIVFIGGDILLVQRFFIPVMPFIYLIIQQGIYRFLKDYDFQNFFKFTAVILVIFSTSLVVFDSRTFPMLGVKRSVDYCNNLETAGKWLKENAPKDSRIAIESAGILPYYSELYTIDRLGLSNTAIAHSEYRGTGFSDRVKRSDEYVLAELKPDYYIDDFPSLNALDKPDIVMNGNVYRFNSIKIGKGEVEDNPGIIERGDLYFNFYKLENND